MKQFNQIVSKRFWIFFKKTAFMRNMILSQNSFVQLLFWGFHWLKSDKNSISAKVRSLVELILKYCPLFSCLWKLKKTSSLTLFPKYTCFTLVCALESRDVKGDENRVNFFKNNFFWTYFPARLYILMIKMFNSRRTIKHF